MIEKETIKTMNIEDLVAVHMTDYIPQNGVIKSRNSVMPEASLRNSVHFSINHPVKGHENGSWDHKAYAVIAPLDALTNGEGNRIWNFNVVDTYFIGDVKLPRGSTVIVSSSGYEDLIRFGIVDRNTLIVHFGDERNPPQPESRLLVEMDGIKYVVLGGNCGTAREEAYKEIARQGYQTVGGGQWDWSGNTPRIDQKKISEKLGVQQRCHFGSDLAGIEYLSTVIRGLSSGRGKQQILAYLRAAEELGGTDEFEGQSGHYPEGSDELKGRDLMLGRTDYEGSQINGFIRSLENARGTIPSDFQRRVDMFLEANKAELRGFIPEPVARQYQLNI